MTAQQFLVRFVTGVALCLAWVTLADRFSETSHADEPASVTDSQPTDTNEPPLVTTELPVPADHGSVSDQEVGAADESPEQTVAERTRKARLREQLRRGFAILLVLVLLAVFVIMLFLLWGIRLRRRLRKPFPVIHKGDELWFLKPATQKPDDHPTAILPDTAPPPPSSDDPPTNAK